MPPARILALAVAAVAVAGCARAGIVPAPPRSPAALRTVPPTPSQTPSATRTASAPRPAATFAAFTSTVSGPLSAADVPHSWRPGCPLAPSALRRIDLRYVGFDGRSHRGAIIVNAAVVPAVIDVFSRLYADRFPIHRLIPIDAYNGSDPASMAADNTSGFNCRHAVAPGPPQWSAHAYGEAIDVDTVENPYVEPGQPIQPPAGAAYVDRADRRPGMAYYGGALVEAFAAVGWQWGGRWSAPDYQHFSATGG
ncbi:MAG TPA: M15 family metallopeptidase [Mycobacteriales bacterium]|nr:M15 family metallopeptidase [Mycobacteriales bacterium]